MNIESTLLDEKIMRIIGDNIPCDLFVQATKLFTTKSTQITVYHI